MRNKTLVGMFLTIILTCASCAVFSVRQSLASSPRRWYVDQKGPPYGDFRSITEAIQSSNVSNGDMIIVNPPRFPETAYKERLYINKSLTILSLLSNIIVDGEGKGDVFTIAVANVTLKDFTIRNSGDNFAAIELETESMDANISGNSISNCGFGIFLNSSSDNLVYKNKIQNCKKYGIYMQDSNDNDLSANEVFATVSVELDGLCIKNSSDNIISNNQISKYRHGMLLDSSQNNTITGNTMVNNREYGVFLDDSGNNELIGNTMKDNKYNFGIEGRFLEDFVQKIDASNTINTKPVCYLANEHNKIVTAGTGLGFVALVNSDNVTVNGLSSTTLTKNSYGVLLVNTNNSKIENFAISGNEHYGVSLLDSHRNEIARNNISGEIYSIGLEASNNNVVSQNHIKSPSSVYGISLNTSTNNEIKNNTIENVNKYGISIIDSSNNTIGSNSIREYGDVGIRLEGSVNSILTDNYIRGKYTAPVSNSCIYLVNSSYNEINMSIMEYGYLDGISLGDLSSNNRIYHNCFIWNIQHVSATGYSNFWDDGYPSGGNFWYGYTGVDEKCGPYQNETGRDGIGDKARKINDYNIDGYPLMNSIHDLAVMNITLSKTQVGINEIVDINVTVENQGFSRGSFDIRISYDTTPIDTAHVILEWKSSVAIIFKWNTTGVPGGNYTISAYATPIPNEINITDNTRIDGMVTIIKPKCDFNEDGKVNLLDVMILAIKFGNTVPPEDPKYDVYKDGKINLLDVQYVAGEFGK